MDQTQKPKNKGSNNNQSDPQGLWGSGENVYLFHGSWAALLITFRDFGSKPIVSGILGGLLKCFKKAHIKGKTFISFDFFLLKPFGLWVRSPPDLLG